jgi:hypothetical protein
VTSGGFSGGLAGPALLEASTVGPAPVTPSPVEAAALPVDAATAHRALEQLDAGHGPAHLRRRRTSRRDRPVVDAGHLVPLVARTLPPDRAAEALRAGAGPHEPARSSYGSATDRPVTTLRSFGDHPK